MIHVAGPSGVGKSALLRRFSDDARDGGALVLHGRCYERESVPYNAFDGALDDLAVQLAIAARDEVAEDLPGWIGELARVFPVLATVPAIAGRLEASPPPAVLPVLELRRRAVHALRDLLGRLAARRPVVLVIDDLQWADADSATLLGRLIAAPPPPGLLIATSFRPEEAAANPAVTRYLADRVVGVPGTPTLVELALAPLAPRDAERLAAAALDAAGVVSARDGLAAAIAAEAAASPFFIEELAHHAARGGGDGVSLDDVLARRVAALPAAERALVEALAVASRCRSPSSPPTWPAACCARCGRCAASTWSRAAARAPTIASSSTTTGSARSCSPRCRRRAPPTSTSRSGAR